jgi:hypothetical protein
LTANEALLLFLVAFWGGFCFLTKVENLRAGKSFSDGPSLVPVIPFFPAVAFGIGWAVNLVAAPWGSWAIAALHAGVIAIVVVAMAVENRGREREDA